MSRLLIAVALIIWTGVPAAQAGGLSPSGEWEKASPGVVVTDVLEVKAALAGIDYQKRTMTLKGLQGRLMTLKADKAVRNFEQLKKGDVVLVDFVESIAISMRDVKAPPSAAEARLVSVAPKGAKTGVLLAETYALTAVVELVDAKARQVTVQEPNGGLRIVPVDRSFKNIDRFRKGEKVVLRVTEPIAIKVERRK